MGNLFSSSDGVDDINKLGLAKARSNLVYKTSNTDSDDNTLDNVVDIIKQTPLVNHTMITPFRTFFQERLNAISSSINGEMLESDIYISLLESNSDKREEEDTGDNDEHIVVSIEDYINTMLSFTIFIDVDKKTQTKYTKFAKYFNSRLKSGEITNLCNVSFSDRIPELALLGPKKRQRFKDVLCRDVEQLTLKVIEHVVISDTKGSFDELFPEPEPVAKQEINRIEDNEVLMNDVFNSRESVENDEAEIIVDEVFSNAINKMGEHEAYDEAPDEAYEEVKNDVYNEEVERDNRKEKHNNNDEELDENDKLFFSIISDIPRARKNISDIIDDDISDDEDDDAMFNSHDLEEGEVLIAEDELIPDESADEEDDNDNPNDEEEINDDDEEKDNDDSDEEKDNDEEVLDEMVDDMLEGITSDTMKSNENNITEKNDVDILDGSFVLTPEKSSEKMVKETDSAFSDNTNTDQKGDEVYEKDTVKPVTEPVDQTDSQSITLDLEESLEEDYDSRKYTTKKKERRRRRKERRRRRAKREEEEDEESEEERERRRRKEMRREKKRKRKRKRRKNKRKREDYDISESEDELITDTE